MTAGREVGSENESGTMMLFQQAWTGLSCIYIGDAEPTDDDCAAWSELADLLELENRSSGPIDQSAESVGRLLDRARVPEAVKALARALGKESVESSAIAQHVSDLRKVALTPIINPDERQRLMVVYAELETIWRTTARSVLAG